MKKLALLSNIVICLIFTGCSKKNDAAPTTQTHTIKVNASASADFTIAVFTAESFGADQLQVKAATVAKGSTFEYSVDVPSKSYIFLKISSEISNKITYKIYDNGSLSDQEVDGEYSTHSTNTVAYTVK